MTNLLSIEESIEHLIQLSAGFSRTMLIIDALDECDAETRETLFNAIENVVSFSKRNPVKAFLTSRDDADVRKKFGNKSNVHIQERDNSSDIDHYIKTQIEACIAWEELLEGIVSRELHGRIISALEADAHGMYGFTRLEISAESNYPRFLWVKYQIKKICDEVTEDGINKALTKFPNDLDEMYQWILSNIRAHQSSRILPLAERTLKWVLYAARPLSHNELIQAVSFQPTSSSYNLFVPVLLDICHNLLVRDGELGVRRFAHFSVQEFLLRQFDAEGDHARLAEVCLTTLLAPAVDYGFESALMDYGVESALMGYATHNWAEHV